MARSSKAQAETNRARIVTAASGLFRAHGTGAVGIAQIMGAVGMTQGGFYRHFASKDALVAEACAHAFAGAVQSWTQVAQDAAHAGGNPARAIEDHYLTPRPAEKTCPMIAFHADAHSTALAGIYTEGTQRLLAIFTSAGRDRNAFAAMIGKAILARAGNTQ